MPEPGTSNRHQEHEARKGGDRPLVALDELDKGQEELELNRGSASHIMPWLHLEVGGQQRRVHVERNPKVPFPPNQAPHQLPRSSGATPRDPLQEGP